MKIELNLNQAKYFLQVLRKADDYWHDDTKALGVDSIEARGTLAAYFCLLEDDLEDFIESQGGDSQEP